MRHDPARDSDRETSGPGVTYYAQAREITKHRCKSGRFTNDTRFFLLSVNAPNCYKRVPVMPSLDGNTVELPTEQIAFTENAVGYAATLDFVRGRVDTIKRALRGD